MKRTMSACIRSSREVEKLAVSPKGIGRGGRRQPENKGRTEGKCRNTSMYLVNITFKTLAKSLDTKIIEDVESGTDRTHIQLFRSSLDEFLPAPIVHRNRQELSRSRLTVARGKWVGATTHVVNDTDAREGTHSRERSGPRRLA